MNLRIIFVFSIFAILFSCRLSAQEEDVLRNFRAKADGMSDISMQGNGYSVNIRTVPVSRDMMKRKWHNQVEINVKKVAASFGLYNRKNMKEHQDSCYWIFTSVEKKKSDSIPVTKTLYVHRKFGNDELRGITFTRKGEVDTLFQREIVDYLEAKGVPHSLFVPVADSVSFYGQKVFVPRSYYSGLNTVGSNTHSIKMRRGGQAFFMSWESYGSLETVEESKLRLLLDRKKENSAITLLLESKDTLLLRGKEIEADRLVWQNHYEVGKFNIITSYLIATKINGIHALIDLNFTTDSISGTTIALPGYIEENFFRLKSPAALPSNLQPDILPSDTSRIPKRDRWPVWTYNDKNVRVTGIAAGIGELSNRKNVTVNGLKLEAPGTSLALTAAIPFVIAPVSLMNIPKNERPEYVERFPVIFKNRLNCANGIYISASGSLNNNHIMNGLGVAGLITAYYRSNGLSVTGINNSNIHGNGLQIAGLYSFSYYMKGVQIGGLYTSSYSAKGVQLGLINHSTSTRGCQIGLINKTKKLKGLQIGLWNKNGKRSLPLINW